MLSRSLDIRALWIDSAAAFPHIFKRKWVWNVNPTQAAAMFIQSHSICTMYYVVHKLQSRFLVKQEVCFYLCCTEQFLEVETQQHEAGYILVGRVTHWLQRGSGCKCMKPNRTGANFYMNWNDNLLGISITRWVTFCSNEVNILMHEAPHECHLAMAQSIKCKTHNCFNTNECSSSHFNNNCMNVCW